MTATFGAHFVYVCLVYALAMLIPAGAALWQASRSRRRRRRLGLRLTGMALLLYGLATVLLVSCGTGLAAFTLSLQVIRGICVLAAMLGGWLCARGRVLRGPRSRLIRRGLLCAGFGLLMAAGWILVDGRARAAVVATGRSVVEVGRGVQAEGDADAQAVDPAEVEGPAMVRGKPGTWEQYSSQRLSTGLPVLLGVFLLIAVTVAFAAIRS